ncbi:ArsR/SmtB family transcription factor [Holophaga foetida]|uniref:ArsR/SmtB family transcription factor n=1 Tax=Holophaga foetida TaxID=35839 RepID=UPI00130ECB8F|nr:metalloregulator ArsR/SmtB family transcription factor [Holophaga foetida]
MERLKAVSHPIRLRVLALLHSSELSVCQVAEILQVPQSSVSEALRELRRAGFVSERKEGRWVFVSVIPGFEGDPLLKGILMEALRLPEVEADRTRAGMVKGQAIAVVCGKVQAAETKEATRV